MSEQEGECEREHAATKTCRTSPAEEDAGRAQARCRECQCRCNTFVIAYQPPSCHAAV